MKLLEGKPVGKGRRVAVVTARFNSEVTQKLETGAVAALKEGGVDGDDLAVARVAGAIEIPLAVEQLLLAGWDGVVAVGAVIRGETSHYDFVCNSVERGCSQLQLLYRRPIGFGVLTTENEEQALERAGGSHGNKGYEAAQVVLEMLDLMDQIKTTPLEEERR